MGGLIRVTDVQGNEHFIGVQALADVVFYTHHPQLEAHITTTGLASNRNQVEQALVVIVRGEHAEALRAELRREVGLNPDGSLAPLVVPNPRLEP